MNKNRNNSNWTSIIMGLHKNEDACRLRILRAIATAVFSAHLCTVKSRNIQTITVRAIYSTSCTLCARHCECALPSTAPAPQYFLHAGRRLLFAFDIARLLFRKLSTCHSPSQYITIIHFLFANSLCHSFSLLVSVFRLGVRWPLGHIVTMHLTRSYNKIYVVFPTDCNSIE